MRLGLYASAVALMLGASPASAAVSAVSISGSLSGTTTTILCNSGPTCLPGNAQSVAPYSSSFNLTVGGPTLTEGENTFSFGSPYSGGLYSGFITNTGGVLTGHDLSFSLQTCAPGLPSVGCQVTSGTARLFAVSGSVPEPATWALMLLGFGAIGGAMRRRRRAPLLQPAIGR